MIKYYWWQYNTEIYLLLLILNIFIILINLQVHLVHKNINFQKINCLKLLNRSQVFIPNSNHIYSKIRYAFFCAMLFLAITKLSHSFIIIYYKVCAEIAIIINFFSGTCKTSFERCSDGTSRASTKCSIETSFIGANSVVYDSFRKICCFTYALTKKHISI